MLTALVAKLLLLNALAAGPVDEPTAIWAILDRYPAADAVVDCVPVKRARMECVAQNRCSPRWRRCYSPDRVLWETHAETAANSIRVRSKNGRFEFRNFTLFPAIWNDWHL